MRPGSRILMTTDTVGGVWQYSLALASAMARRGVGVVLAAVGRPPSEAQRAAAQAVPGLLLEEFDGRLEWMADSQEDIAAAGAWLLDLEAATAPDIVHANAYSHAALPWRAPCLLVAHSCVRSWWQSVHGAPPPAEWDAYGRLVKEGLAAADRVVAPTVAFLRQIEGLYGPLPKGQVIWNGRDPAAYRAGDKQPLVFAAGRAWDQGKNIAAVAAVAADLAWPVVVAGDWCGPDGRGEPPPGLNALGQIDDAVMADWFARAAVFVLPARYEPFGLAPLEAGLSGCALVLGDIPTLREVWSGAALFVDPSDHRALRAALRALEADPARVAALGAAARKRAAAFTTERMAAAYADAYAQLLARGGLGRPGRPADLRALFTVH